MDWYPPVTCKYCEKRIVREQVGWRSDEHDPHVDRVRCPDSPQAHPYERKHVPMSMMQAITVRSAGCCSPEMWTGDPS